MKVNIKNIILLIELEQFEEDAKEISKTIRFVLKNYKFYSILYSLSSVKFVLVYQFWKMKKRGVTKANPVLLPKCYEQRLYTDKDLLVWINQK